MLRCLRRISWGAQCEPAILPPRHAAHREAVAARPPEHHILYQRQRRPHLRIEIVRCVVGSAQGPDGSQQATTIVVEVMAMLTPRWRDPRATSKPGTELRGRCWRPRLDKWIRQADRRHKIRQATVLDRTLHASYPEQQELLNGRHRTASVVRLWHTAGIASAVEHARLHHLPRPHPFE